MRRAKPPLTPLDAGPFAAWLRMFLGALRKDKSMPVPCGDCTACCTSKRFVHIGAGETRTLKAIPPELAFPAPFFPAGTRVLGFDKQGHCPMFKNDACSIYKSRPLTCRMFDCRILAATGLATGGDDAIHRQARRWRFTLDTCDDTRLQTAVLRAAAFLAEHTDAFPRGWLPPDPVQRAVVAAVVHGLFLGAPGPSVQKVVETFEKR